MQLIALDPEQSGLYSPLVLDYLNKDPFFTPFIHQWPNREGFAEMIRSRKKTSVDREYLVQCLKDQYLGIELYEQEKHNLELLRKPNAYTLCTGQQIHIFLGPMYVYWKIVSTIALSRKLKKEFPSEEFIPVFWMATEDHDYAEISYLDLFNRRLEWKEHQNGSGPVGRLETGSLLPLLDELDELFSRQESWKTYSEIFREAYASGDNLAKATRKAVHTLFGKEGLLILDPDDVALKRDLKPLILKELREGTSHHAVDAQSALLEERYKSQVHPRPINLFYTHPEKGRERIERSGRQYHLPDGTVLFDAEYLEQWVDRNLSDISTNVVTRPMYQEIILPNLAYIGGPGETAYWMQLKSAFDLYNISFPILENRKSVFLFLDKNARQLEKLNLLPSDLFLDEDDLRKRAVAQGSGSLVTLEEELEKLRLLKDEAIGKVGQFLPQQAKPMADVFNNAEKFFKKIEKEIFTLQEKAVEKGIEKALKLKSQLRDKQFTQERNHFLVQYLNELETGKILRKIEEKYTEFGPVGLLLT